MQRLVAGVAVALGFLACAPAAKTPPQDTTADKAAVDAIRNHELAALNAGNIDSLMVVYADDIDMMAPGYPAARGTAAVREMAMGMLKDATVSANYTSSAVEVIGDVAIDRYTLTMTVTPKAGGVPMTEQMKGLHVLRKQPDGTWRIVQDTWNADGPPPAPPPPPKK